MRTILASLVGLGLIASPMMASAATTPTKPVQTHMMVKGPRAKRTYSAKKTIKLNKNAQRKLVKKNTAGRHVRRALKTRKTSMKK